MSYLWNPVPTPIFTQSGAFARGAQAYFYVGASTTPLTVYGDAAFVNALPWPVTANNVGVFPSIFIPYGTYRVRILNQEGVLISDTSNIDNPAPPSSGGGIVVTQDMVIQTGDPFWRMRSGLMNGFVRMNANTIGSVSSGATELASASAQNLFLFCWNQYNNTLCPVSGGRGVSAAADWAANKTIVIPTMRGLIAGGLDDMGGASAGVIQAITTCTTNNTNVVVVISAANIAVGMHAIVNGVAVGTVTAIVGTSITLSGVAAGSAAGISFRASSFADATFASSMAGGVVIKPTTDQMPAHAHGITDPGHKHSYNNAYSLTQFQPGGGLAYSAFAVVDTSTSTTGITINSSGGGNPVQTLPPMALGTWYMKL